MENLAIFGSNIVPKVEFDPKSGIMRITGRMVTISSQEYQFFGPIYEWMREYAQNPAPITRMIVDMEFCSSACTKNLYQLFKILEQMHKDGRDVQIEWKYFRDDEDAKDKGAQFRSLLTLPIEITPHA